MAVGKDRHYLVNDIVPRHFIYTAKQADMGETTVTAIFEELLATSGAAFDEALATMPATFPQALADSIIEGNHTRLRLLTVALVGR